MARQPVIVLFGGPSSEHEISILSARNIFHALDRERFEPFAVGLDKKGVWRRMDPERLLAAQGSPKGLEVPADDEKAPPIAMPAHPGALPDPFSEDAVVFSTLHGQFGEDGRLQGYFDMLGLAYVGSGLLGSAVSMDKDISKRLLSHADIPVVPWVTLHRSGYDHATDDKRTAWMDEASALGYPLFVKPANAGSSVGVSKVKRREDLEKAIETAFAIDSKVIIEAGIAAREIELAVLGEAGTADVSPPGEIIVTHPDGFYSYDAKYVDPDGARAQIPADLPEDIVAYLKDLSKRAFEVLNLSGLARVDFFVERGTLEVYLNEVNTLPGFTAISMYPKLWAETGVGPTELLSRLIDLARATRRIG
jgi:D-alanine-D-alanine ligase